MEQAYLGLGSNLGDRLANLQKAVDELKNCGTIFATSPVFECDSLYDAKMPGFLNAIVVIETPLDAHALLEKTKGIEKAMGRTGEQRGKGASRAIDIDILFYGCEMIEEPELVVPHPLMLERLFVLLPLEELNPGIEINGKKIGSAVKRLRKAKPSYRIEKTKLVLAY